MISTASTKPIDYHRQDGGLRDPNPRRRAARLNAAGVTVARTGRLEHVVRHGERETARFRTLRGAERHAHALADRRAA
jgi:hypothetical protein